MADARAIELTADDRGELLTEMAALADDRSGWVNLAPRVDPELVPSRGGLAAAFSARGPIVPLATWVPGRAGKRGTDPSSLGVQHPLGTRAAPTLRELGISTPEGYRLVSDNPKRGLVLESDEPGRLTDVLDWMIRVTGGTCPVEFDGWWVAGVVRR